MTYNPDLCRLKENLDAILAQVEGLVIVDNGSDNVEDICGLVEGRQDITVIWNEKNCGIARALNQVVEHAANMGWQWVLTADQDSVMMEGLVDNYRGYMGFEKIGMMTCLFLDRNFGIQQEHEFEGEYRFVERCITSGCLTNVAAVREVGGFDEAMFIDYVDFDICYTLREHGYRILQSHFRGVLHELGSKGERKFFFGREVIVTNHSPARRYYYSRNVVYFIRKHRGHVNALRYYIKLYGRLGVVIVYEKNKCSKLRQGFRGIVDGYRMPLP